MTIVPPIVVAEGLDVALHPSPAEAARSLEARDVAGGVYRAWDATGRPLRIDIGDAVCIDLAPVHLSAQPADASAAATLADTLRGFLAATGTPAAPSATLPELLELAAARTTRAR